MVETRIQYSFHAGEWAPALNARVDLAKYHSAAALIKNFYVDYRGGISSRMGTVYVLQAYKSATDVRLIGFQATAVLGYVLEFGDLYIRFHNEGGPVLETAKNITGATQANPGVITSNAHGYADGDWVFIDDVGGMTQLNDRFYIIAGATANTFTLTDLLGNAINTTGFGAYTAGGTVQRVYTLPSPYLAADLALLKYAQNVDKLYICHPDYAPQILTLISANNWTIGPISFGATISAPTNIAVATTLAAGTVNYSYTVTAVDANGQESSAGTAAALANRQDLRTVAGTNRVTWTAVSGAVSYNVYKTELSYTNAVPAGAAHGYIGNTQATTFDDSNIAPDFSIGVPLVKNPFSGASIASITITDPGGTPDSYDSVPSVTIDPPTTGVTALGNAVLQVQQANSNSAVGSTTWNVGDIAYFYPAGSWTGITAVVATLLAGRVATFQPMTYPGSNPGSVSAGSVPTGLMSFLDAPTVGASTKNGQGQLFWGVGFVTLTQPGAGYTAVPNVVFGSAGTADVATATAVLNPALGNPSVPAFFQQRFVLAGQVQSPQTFYMSQPGSYFNFNTSDPVQPDNAITGTIISAKLNEIKAMLPMSAGLIIFSNSAAWQVYGESPGNPVSAINTTAQSQAYNGASDIPPIIANQEILYVQAKGNSIRDLSYNFYTNIYTGTDISVLSSHLFFNYQIVGWDWAEEPFKLLWAVRDDGALLSLTFLKEQDLIGWTQHDTQGLFKSVAVVTEDVVGGRVDAPYFCVEREVDGQTVKYIERMADRFFETHIDAHCVDSGLIYDGAPATNFSGLEHLQGMDVVGLADGIPFTTTVSATGTFTLSSAASVVHVGLAYEPQLQTLSIDTGLPTIQGNQKAIPKVTVRVDKTLGLAIGATFATAVAMKDLVLGNVGSSTNERVTGLVTGDAETIIDARYTDDGKYCISQPLPYPAQILGVIPQIAQEKKK